MMRYMTEEDRLTYFPVPADCLKATNLFAYEFSISELLGEMRPENGMMLKKSFCLKNTGNVRYSIWSNEHALNEIRIFNDS